MHSQFTESCSYRYKFLEQLSEINKHGLHICLNKQKKKHSISTHMTHYWIKTDFIT